MSQAARLHAARKGLEAILRLARERQDVPLEALADLALSASGETESQLQRRAADADRKRTARGRPPDIRADGVRISDRTASGHEGGEGGGVSPDLLSDQDLTLKIALSSSLEGTGEGPHAVRTPSAARVTSDGASWLGKLMAAFEAGVTSVTALPYPVDAGAPTNSIITAVRAYCKDPLQREEWVRTKAAAWARTRLAESRTLSPFDFKQWLGSGELPPKVRGVVIPVDAKATASDIKEQLATIEENGRRAREADAAQQQRAERAARRPPTGLAPIGQRDVKPTKVLVSETTVRIDDQERARQQKAAEDFMRTEQSKGAVK